MNDLKRNNMLPYGDNSPGLWGYLGGIRPSIYYTIIAEFENLKVKANKLGMQIKPNEANLFGTAGLIEELRKEPQVAPYKFNLIVDNTIDETEVEGKFNTFVTIQPIEE